ncbi:hypothetical protein BH11MYX4_BH11MYX4_33340 [soil metagenome]
MTTRRGRGAITTFALAIMIAASVGYAGCEAVPDIQFVADDARADAPSEGGPGDGSVDASVRDSSSDACVGASPAAGATCCGTIWCVGDCDQANCDQCAQKATTASCQAGDICCGKSGTVLCKKQCP